MNINPPPPEELVKRIEKALRDADIHIRIDGCGCCGSPWIEVDGCFFDDAAIDSTMKVEEE